MSNNAIPLSIKSAYSLTQDEIYFLLKSLALPKLLRLHLIYTYASYYLIKHFKWDHFCNIECRMLFEEVCQKVKNVSSNVEFAFFLFCLDVIGKPICRRSSCRNSGFPYFIRTKLDRVVRGAIINDEVSSAFLFTHQCPLYKQCKILLKKYIHPFMSIEKCLHLLLKCLKQNPKEIKIM